MEYLLLLFWVVPCVVVVVVVFCLQSLLYLVCLPPANTVPVVFCDWPLHKTRSCSVSYVWHQAERHHNVIDNLRCVPTIVMSLIWNTCAPLSRDPVTNTSGLTLGQLSAFKNLEEITGTQHLLGFIQEKNIYEFLYFSFYPKTSYTSILKA